MNRTEFLRIYSKNAKDAAKRLATVKLTDTQWEDAVHIYELAYARNLWDRKTERERKLWMDDYKKTLERLIGLLEEAPRPPNESDHVFGPEVHEVLTDEQYSRVMNSRAFTIVDALRADQAGQEINSSSPLLKKPRDEDSARAYFLQEFQQHHKECSAAEVARIATALFGSEIDERKVRKFRGRTHS